jgi:hypothetical protein
LPEQNLYEADSLVVEGSFVVKQPRQNRNTGQALIEATLMSCLILLIGFAAIRFVSVVKTLFRHDYIKQKETNSRILRDSRDSKEGTDQDLPLASDIKFPDLLFFVDQRKAIQQLEHDGWTKISDRNTRDHNLYRRGSTQLLILRNLGVIVHPSTSSTAAARLRSRYGGS